MMNNEYLSEHYDHSETYHREIQELVNELQKRCIAVNIPMVAAVCYRNGDDGYSVHQATNFIGVERTPLAFLAAFKAVKLPALSRPILDAAYELEEAREHNPTTH